MVQLVLADRDEGVAMWDGGTCGRAGSYRGVPGVLGVFRSPSMFVVSGSSSHTTLSLASCTTEALSEGSHLSTGHIDIPLC